ncbi:MAG: hypothetical protein SGJ10_07665 [Bacteroidota bacterium]|nr:hypothetical protein [Bacteroidota bacterium]
MKKITTYLFAIAFTFASCNKSVKSRLPGSWIITSQNVKTSQTVGGNTQTSDNTSAGGNYTFNSNGTGTTNNTDNGKTTSFTWVATENSITFTDSEGSYAVTVVTNEKKKQKWTFDYSMSYNDPFVGQISQKVSGTIEVAKQ